MGEKLTRCCRLYLDAEGELRYLARARRVLDGREALDGDETETER